MSKPASASELNDLHAAVAKSLRERIEQDMKDLVPTDAATLGAAIKFLKDNNISADPENSEDLTILRNDLTEQARQRDKERAEKRAGVLKLIKKDGDVMTGTGG